MEILKQIGREPLVQFLVIGALLFAVYRLPRSESLAPPNNQI
jgi:hypothetical protein